MEEMREETQAEEQKIVQERGQSESRLAALAVLQRPIRELLPTLPPAVALGHHAPVRDALELMRQKQLSCVLVVEHGQLVGVLTERDVVTKVVATPLDVDHVPLREVMQPDPECLHLDDALVYAFHQMQRGRSPRRRGSVRATASSHTRARPALPSCPMPCSPAHRRIGLGVLARACAGVLDIFPVGSIRSFLRKTIVLLRAP